MTHTQMLENFSRMSQAVIQIVAQEFGLTAEQVKSKGRYGRIPDSRKVVSLLLNHHSEMLEGRPNWTRIATEIRPGMRHCSVYYLSNQAQNLCVSDENFARIYTRSKNRCELELGLFSKEIPKHAILVIDKRMLVKLGIEDNSINVVNLKALAERVTDRFMSLYELHVYTEALKMGFAKSK